MQFVVVGMGMVSLFVSATISGVWFVSYIVLQTCWVGLSSRLREGTKVKVTVSVCKKLSTLSRRCFVPTYFVLQILWQFPSCIFLCESKFPDTRYAEFFEPRNHVLNYIIGCWCTGCQRYALYTFEPIRIQIISVLYELPITERLDTRPFQRASVSLTTFYRQQQSPNLSLLLSPVVLLDDSW